MTKNTKIKLALIVILAAFLRFWNLTSVPSHLYWDEASLAYNAFSILTEGVDEHGVSWPVTHFLAYGDAKPPLYVYTTALAMKIFGVNDFSVRFSSALAGVVAIPLTFFLVKQLFLHLTKQKTSPDQTALIAALMLAISPWHLQMSRAAFEANLALALFLGGLLTFFYGLKRPKYWLVSASLFVSTLYTFNSYRIFLPFFLLLLAFTFFKQIKAHPKWLILGSVLASILIAPLIPFVTSDQAKLRFEEVTIFKNHAPVIEANQRIGLNNSALWSKVIYNRRVLFALDFLDHYFDHFKPNFLFFSGDVNPRLSVREIGELYPIELPILIIGLYLVATKHKKLGFFVTTWMLLSIIPAATARETPHALRILQILPTYQIVIAIAITWQLKKNKTLPLIIAAAYILSFGWYLNVYHTHYNNHWSSSWQHGYKQTVEFVQAIESNYDRIYVTKSLGRPHTYFLYYGKVSPKFFTETRTVASDPFGFVEVNGFGKYVFGDIQFHDEKALVVTDVHGLPNGKTPLKTITDLNDQVAFYIYEL